MRYDPELIDVRSDMNFSYLKYSWTWETLRPWPDPDPINAKARLYTSYVTRLESLIIRLTTIQSITAMSGKSIETCLPVNVLKINKTGRVNLFGRKKKEGEEKMREKLAISRSWQSDLKWKGRFMAARGNCHRRVSKEQGGTNSLAPCQGV